MICEQPVTFRKDSKKRLHKTFILCNNTLDYCATHCAERKKDSTQMNGKKQMWILLVVVVVAAAAALGMTVSAKAEEAEAQTDPVLATIDGAAITQSECDEFITYYADQGYTLDYATAVEALLSNKALEMLVDELGYNTFTEEEEASIREQAQAQWDSMLDTYVEYYLTDDTEEARAELKTAAEQYYSTAYGYDFDYVLDYYTRLEAYSRYYNALVSEDSIADEEIQAQFDASVEQWKSYIGDSAYMYELYSYYYGTPYYRPAGYRAVLHILLTVDDDLMSAYTTAKTEYETLKAGFDAQNETAEATEEAAESAADTAAETEEEAAEPVTQEQVDAAKDAMEAAKEAVLASKQTELDDIEARLASGESFADIAAQYHEDPGQDLTAGYELHGDFNSSWEENFYEAAFSDEMQQPGDHSKPVISSFGIHVLYYLKDLDEGAVEMTDDIKSDIREELYETKLNEAIQAACDARMASAEIVRMTDLINELDAADTEEETAEDAAETTETTETDITKEESSEQ